MRREESTLFAPYQSLGVVCGNVAPVFQLNFIGQKSRPVVYCALGNAIAQFHSVKLRQFCLSEPLPGNISVLAADKRFIYAACGRKVVVVKLCRSIENVIDLGAVVEFMNILGDQLIVVDAHNDLRVFSTEDWSLVLHMEGSAHFTVTAIVHPATYMNKIVLGSNEGKLRIVNIRTGKIVHEFDNGFKSAIRVLVQTPAVDVLAIGLEDGRIILMNIRVDEIICEFRHDVPITAIGFRNDGEPLMTSADTRGHLAVWDLEKKELVGNVTKFHSQDVTAIHFHPAQPIMTTCSADNSIRVWALDGADGMPRQLLANEGHSDDVAAIVFQDKKRFICSGLDGTVRQYAVNHTSLRQKLGSAGTMSKSKASKKGLAIETIRLEPVVEVVIGWSREAAWDNVLARHRDTLIVTTWTSRKGCQGTHNLVHKRFTTDASLFHASATSIAMSPCGNFALIGYSTGHVDQFNVQSGRFVKTFVAEKTETPKGAPKKQVDDSKKAHSAAVRALSVDVRGHELISGCESGTLRFWAMSNGRLQATMRTRHRILRSSQAAASSLLAIACASKEQGEGANIAIVDTLCRRVVRNFNNTGKEVKCLTFSPDGRWLLAADELQHIRIWELSTSHLIDVVLFETPCVGLAFNPSGEYLATVHQDSRAVHVWANKMLWNGNISVKALPNDYLPSWEQCRSAGKTVIGDESFLDSDSDDDDNIHLEKNKTIEQMGLLSLSGLAPSRWANLPHLDVIKERNKPTQPVRKPKQAPFFLTAAPTLEGFEFAQEDDGDDATTRKELQAKRGLLEMESAFAGALRKASDNISLLAVFDSYLKRMSVSAIDFQIRTLPVDLLLNFIKMITEAIKRRTDFELTQAYLAAAMKIHRLELWSANSEDLTTALSEISLELEGAWQPFDEVITETASSVQWIKNALL